MRSDLFRHFVVSEFPFPIAYSFRKALEEKDSRDASCGLLLSTIEYLAQVLVADYLAGEERDPELDAELTRALHGPPAAGVWRDWTYRILMHYRRSGRQPVLGDLEPLADRQAQRELRRLVEWRNRWVHAGVQFDLGAFRRKLFSFLERIHLIYRSVLFCPQSSRFDGSLHFTRSKLLKGDNPHFAEVECRSSVPFVSGQVYLYSAGSGEIISLHPWVTYAHCSQCNEHHYYHFNRPSGRKISYISVPRGHSRIDAGGFLIIEQLFRHGKPRRLRPRHFTLPGAASGLQRTLRPGDAVGPYQVAELIKIGGTSQIYRVLDTRTEKPYALKLLPIELSRDPTLLLRFEEEAANLKRMSHPNVVALHDFGEDFGDRYLVLDLAIGGHLAGQSCRDLAEIQKPLSEEAIIDIGKQVCDGLFHIHTRGISHRDLKPGNILVTADKVVLADFGVSRARGNQRITLPGLPVGTAEYMSPEQTEEEEAIDHRSDIYSLGCVLFELATGRPPYRAETPLATALCHLQASPPRIEDLNPAISTGLANIIYRALQKRPELRYQSAMELRRDLDCASDDPAGPQPLEGQKMPQDRLAEVQAREREHYRRRLRLVSTLAVALLIALGFLYHRETQRSAEHDRRLAELWEERAALIGRQLYASKMHMAIGAWENREAAGSKNHLRSLEPPAGEEDKDVRGVAWHCLWRLLHQEIFSTRTPGAFASTADFSNDGRFLAAGIGEKVELWDLESGKHQVVPLEGNVSFLSFLPGAKAERVAAVGGGVFALFERAGSAWVESESLPYLTGVSGITAFAASQSGEHALTAYLDGSVILWNLARGERIHAFDAAGVTRVAAISPGGTAIAYASNDFGLRLARPRDQAADRPLELDGHESAVTVLAFSPDGSRLASGGHDGAVCLWDVLRSSLVTKSEEAHKMGVYALCFSPDNRWLATGGADHLIRLRRPKDLEVDLTIIGHEQRLRSLAFSPCGNLLAAGDSEGTFKLWRPSSIRNGPIIVDGFPDTIDQEVVWTETGQELVVANRRLDVRAWNLSDPSAGGPFPSRSPVGDLARSDYTAFALSPDGALLALAEVQGDVVILETGEGTEIARMGEGRPRANDMEFSADSATLFVARRGPPQGVTGRGALIDRYEKRPAAEGLRAAGRKHVWREGPRLSTHIPEIDPLRPSPDGRILATVRRRESTVTLWDLETEKVLANLEGHTDWVTALAFSADARFLATGGLDTTIRFWDVSADGLQQGKPPTVLDGHTNAVATLAFSPDGLTLVSGGDDRTIRVWDLLTGEERAILRGHEGHVNGLAFSPDGTLLAAVGGLSRRFGEVKVWLVGPRLSERDGDEIRLPKDGLQGPPLDLPSPAPSERPGAPDSPRGPTKTPQVRRK